MSTATAAPLEYLPDNPRIRHRPLWYHNRGLQQTASGYGRKLNSGMEAFHAGRWYRIYVCTVSNSGTAYIVTRGRWLIVPNTCRPTE